MLSLKQAVLKDYLDVSRVSLDKERVVAIIEGSATIWAKAYSQGVGKKMPNASQSGERFYVMQLFSRATDKVRCAERRKADERRRMLTGTDYVWLKGEENLTEHHRASSSTQGGAT